MYSTILSTNTKWKRTYFKKDSGGDKNEHCVANSLLFNELGGVPLAGLEPATHGLGIHCSIHTELQGHPG